MLTAAFLFWVRQAQVRTPLARADPELRHRAGSSSSRIKTGSHSVSTQLNGKIWIADFIFSTCPGPCPMISSRMGDLQRPLEKSDVHLVSFTVDPETDTPEVLRDYAKRVHAEPGRWDFLTGEQKRDLRSHAAGFKLAVAEARRKTAGRCTRRAPSWSIGAARSAATTTSSRRTP